MGNKYHNRPGYVNGKRFDSQREARRFLELKLMERAGEISNLKTQVPYMLIPSQYKDGKCILRSCKYVADFVYWRGKQLVVEDAKGDRTDVYMIKKKLMYQVYGILIKET